METNGVEPIQLVDLKLVDNRKRVRRVHVAGLAVAVVVFAAAAVFAVQTTTDRGEAARARRIAERELRVQRVETRAAEHDLDARRTEARTTEVGLTGMLASAQGLVTLADQGLDAARATQTVGATDPIATADEYNAAVDRANAIVDQYNATLDILDRQIDDFASSGATQPA